VRIALVVAVARNGVIGRAGGLAWRISDDLRHFRRVTLGKPVVMGRRTFDSIGKPLPGRANIVISRRSGSLPGAVLARSLPEALAEAEAAARRLGAEETCVIGGGEIYRAALPVAGRIYLTEVDAEPEGDTHFPAIDEAEWVRRLTGDAPQGPTNEHACRFFILDRRESGA